MCSTNISMFSGATRLCLPFFLQVQKVQFPGLDESLALMESTPPDPLEATEAPVPQHGLLETASRGFSKEEKTKSGDMLLGGASGV